MRASLYFILTALLFFSPAFSENYTTLWTGSYNLGSTSYDESSMGTAFDSFGNRLSTAYFDFTTTMVFKHNSSGSQLWNISTGAYQGIRLAVDSNDSIYVTGQTRDANGFMILLKYNSSGSQLWNKTISYSTSAWTGLALDRRNDNVVVTGYYSTGSENNFITAKYYPNGTIAWNRTYDPANDDSAEGMAVDSAGNVIVTGRADGGYSGMPIVKYNENGTLNWSAIVWDGDVNEGWGVAADSQNRIYIAGASEDYSSTNYNLRVMGYYANGTLIWDRTYDIGTNERAEAIDADSTGNITVVGYTYIGSNFTGFVMRFYPNGTQISNMTYGNGGYNFFMSVASNPRGDISIAGTTGNSTDSRIFAGMYEVYPNPQLVINVSSPANLTMYPSASVSINASSNLTAAWMYSLNGAANVTFTPNTTITAINGLNRLWIYASTSGRSTSTYLEFNATVSEIIISGSQIGSPEFGMLCLLSLFASAMAVVAFKKRD